MFWLGLELCRELFSLSWNCINCINIFGKSYQSLGESRRFKVLQNLPKVSVSIQNFAFSLACILKFFQFVGSKGDMPCRERNFLLCCTWLWQTVWINKYIDLLFSLLVISVLCLLLSVVLASFYFIYFWCKFSIAVCLSKLAVSVWFLFIRRIATFAFYCFTLLV